MRFIPAVALDPVSPAAASAYAESAGDAVAGEAYLGRQCLACPVVENVAGEVLVGRVGPDRNGGVGRMLEGLLVGADQHTINGQDEAGAW